MSVHSSQKKRRRDPNKIRFQSLGNHDKFMDRIMKTLYYGKFPALERFSLPVTELAVEIYTETTARKTLERLRLDRASEISRNACMSPCSFVLALLYLERLKSCNPSYVERVSPSELFLISMMVATKFLNDSGEDDDVLNSEWACSIGLPLKTINSLEKEFLDAIDWKVFVRCNEFWSKFGELERMVATREGNKRGWFSYSELEVLLDYINCIALAQSVVTVSAVCLASYMAGMFAVIGSTILATNVAASCTNLIRHSPSVASLLHSNLPQPSSFIPIYSSNGSLDDYDFDAEEVWNTDLVDLDLISEIQENSSEFDQFSVGFQLNKPPIYSFSGTSSHIGLTKHVAPLIRQFKVISPGPLIPNR